MCKQSFRIYERMIRLMENEIKQPGLYRSELEHDACGIGAIVSINGIKTHQTVSDALSIVENLEHRAGKDAEGKTGDGVGILLQISHKFFKKAVKPLGIELGDERDYGVGMFFFPQDELARNRAKKMFEIIVEKEGLEFLGWRDVPTFPNVLGKKAVDCMPYIMQGFVKRPANAAKGIEFDRRLYVARRVFEQTAEDTTTYVHYQAERLYTRVCSLLDSFASSLATLRILIMSQLLHLFIQDSQLTLIQAGRELILTDSWYITVRLILSRVMQTEC